MISIYTCTIHFRILLWWGGGEGGGSEEGVVGGAVGEGVRLWLFIYRYIDIKRIKNEIDQIGSFILMPST